MKGRGAFALACVLTIVLLTSLTPFASAAPPATSSIIHIVRPGETLYGIARYYGVDMWTIARVNNILNPNRIYVGQRLTIPTGATTGFIHVVQPGETLTRIALRYGVSTWAIAQANGIYNMNYIWVGQRLLIPGVGYSPPAQPSGAWYGEYFNNLTLAGPPCYTRYDAGVNFNWGWGAPAPAVPADGFSVRWTRTAYFSGGTYRFYARVDDGVRVWVDGALIIDQWRDGAVRTFTADRTLSAGNHQIRVEYYDRIQVARIHFWWEPLVIAEPTQTPTPTQTPVGEGWFARFYNNMDLLDPPVASRYDPWIGFEWGTGSPMPGVRSDFFSVRWTTTAYLEAGTYRFCAMIDDGARIFVDGVRVLDEWHPTNGLAFCGEHTVAAGNHSIEVQYYEEGGNALIYVWWEKK